MDVVITTIKLTKTDRVRKIENISLFANSDNNKIIQIVKRI